jgi:hypothetical protein
LESPETGSQNLRYGALSRWQRPHTRYLNLRKARKMRGIRQNSSETGKCRFVSDCVVVDAATIEPVSTANSLLTGKRTRNFAESGLPMRFLSLIHERIQKLAAKFPTQRNREFLQPEQGISSKNREFRTGAREQGTRPRTNFLTLRVPALNRAN